MRGFLLLSTLCMSLALANPPSLDAKTEAKLEMSKEAVSLVPNTSEDITGYFLGEPYEDGSQPVIEVFKHDGKYYGFGFANTNLAPPKRDVKNKAKALNGRSLKGAIFLWDVIKDGKEYDDGRIYNFATGKSYNAAIKLSDDGIELRATFLGFGKTLHWKRLKNISRYKPYLLDYKELLPQLREIREAD